MGQGLTYVQCDGSLKFRYVRLAASNIRCDVTPSLYFAFTTQEFYERTQGLQIGHGMPDRARMRTEFATERPQLRDSADPFFYSKYKIVFQVAIQILKDQDI